MTRYWDDGKYSDYLNWLVAGYVLCMVGGLLAVVHHFVKNKFLVLGGALLVLVGFVCTTIGMFVICTAVTSSQI